MAHEMQLLDACQESWIAPLPVAGQDRHSSSGTDSSQNYYARIDRSIYAGKLILSISPGQAHQYSIDLVQGGIIAVSRQSYACTHPVPSREETASSIVCDTTCTHTRALMHSSPSPSLPSPHI